jgi:hypothetical protein
MAYTEKQIESKFKEICEQIAEGKSLRKVLLHKDMPGSETFYKWLDSDTDKSKRYTRAHDDRVEVRFESIEADYNETPERDADTNKIDPGWVQLQRLKIHSKQWELSKLNPKKYSDKIQVDTTEFKEQPLFGNE